MKPINSANKKVNYNLLQKDHMLSFSRDTLPELILMDFGCFELKFSKMSPKVLQFLDKNIGIKEIFLQKNT